jgi:hypothetical protein
MLRFLITWGVVLASSGIAVAQSDVLSAKTVADSSLAMFQAPKGYILRAAEKMPDEHFSFRPSADVRSFAEILGHVADGHYLVCSMALGEKSPNPEMQHVEKTKRSKPELIQALTDSAAYCERAHAQLAGPRGAEVIDWFGTPHPRVATLFFNTGHDWESYGTLVAYMRIKGIVPRSSEPRK